MTTTAITKAKVKEAVALDAAIDDGLRSFIELGALLMQMRDTGLYLCLPGENFTTFDEYTEAKKQIGVRHARHLIRSHITCNALGTNSSRSLPSSETHARVLCNNVVDFKTKVLSHHESEGAAVVPVGVANTDELRDVWAGVSEDYAAACEDNPKTRMTAAFIYDSLPPEHQTERKKKKAKKLPKQKRIEVLIKAVWAEARKRSDHVIYAKLQNDVAALYKELMGKDPS